MLRFLNLQFLELYILVFVNCAFGLKSNKDTPKISEYEFRRGTNAARHLSDVYEADKTNERTTLFRFARFCSGKFIFAMSRVDD